MVKIKNGLVQIYHQIFDTIPMGLFLLDSQHAICAWNNWMVKNTNIPEQKALGKTLEVLYPEFIGPRLLSALDLALNYGYPQVLSSILNQFIIPVPLETRLYRKLGMMHQDVEILPIRVEQESMALVVIRDVSAKTHLESTLLSIANKFEKTSLIDMLTGISNRRCLWRNLERELKNAKEQGYNIVCCMYDLDYFKAINDEFGHSGGDEILIAFANLVKPMLKSYDYFFRYGGEEFITLSTHLAVKEAINLPKQLQTELAMIEAYGTVRRKITCSIGISYWQPSDLPISAEELIQRADIELYKAKQSGRNCIVMDGSIYPFCG